MDFDKVFNIFKDEGSREEFLVRLKQVGETSEEFQSLSKIMLSLGMGRTPRHVYETTILQNTFTFCEPFECFTKFQLVCKSWKFAVETKPRFDHIDSTTVKFINKCFRFGDPKLYVSYKKTVQSLKNIEMKDNDVDQGTFELITKSTRDLTSFAMDSSKNLARTEYESSILELLRNSHESLRELDLPSFIFPQNLTFSNLTEITLNFCDEYTNTIPPQEFKLQFQNFLPFVPNIKIIQIDLTNIDPYNEDGIEILDFVGTTYGKHCVTCTGFLGCNNFDLDDHLLNHIPLRIMMATFQLDKLAAMRYANQIQYLALAINIVDVPGIATNAWHNYKIILQSFTSLKGFCIVCYDFNSNGALVENEFYENQELMEALGESNLEFWRTRINYMKSIGIKILDQKEFDSMEENISKTIPWIFEFWPYDPQL